MTTFNESDHPRGAAGKFAEKLQSPDDVSLTTSAKAPTVHDQLVHAKREFLGAQQTMRTLAAEALRDYFVTEFPGVDRATFRRSGSSLYDSFRYDTVTFGGATENVVSVPPRIRSLLSDLGDDAGSYLDPVDGDSVTCEVVELVLHQPRTSRP